MKRIDWAAVVGLGSAVALWIGYSSLVVAWAN